MKHEPGGRAACAADEHRPRGDARLADPIGEDAGAPPIRARRCQSPRTPPRNPPASSASRRRQRRGSPTANVAIHVHTAYSSHMWPRYPSVASRVRRSANTRAAAPGSKRALLATYGPSRTMMTTSAPPRSASADADSINLSPVERRRRRGQQVWKRRADRQRADQDAERRAAPLVEPAGGDFHARRIHPGERGAGRDTQGDQPDRAVGGDERGVGGRGDHAADRKQPARVDDVGQIQQRREQRAGDEPALHRHRQPGGLGRRRDRTRRRWARLRPWRRTTASSRGTWRATATPAVPPALGLLGRRIRCLDHRAVRTERYHRTPAPTPTPKLRHRLPRPTPAPVDGL